MQVNHNHSGIQIAEISNGVYVTCPDDAQYRLDWIKDIYTPDMNTTYVYPNVFMSMEDVEELSNLNADITKTINAAKSNFVINGFTDDDWDQLQSDLESYGLEDYLAIFRTFLRLSSEIKSCFISTLSS